MSPNEIKACIVQEKLHLEARAAKGEILYSCIDGLIEASAREGARHGGIPEYWREYLPKKLF